MQHFLYFESPSFLVVVCLARDGPDEWPVLCVVLPLAEDGPPHGEGAAGDDGGVGEAEDAEVERDRVVALVALPEEEEVVLEVLEWNKNNVLLDNVDSSINCAIYKSASNVEKEKKTWR